MGSCGGGSFRSGMQSPTGVLGALGDDGEVGAGLRLRSRASRGRIPKQSLGTTRLGGLDAEVEFGDDGDDASSQGDEAAENEAVCGAVVGANSGHFGAELGA